MPLSKKEKGRQWDGVSRPTDDKYRENFNRIFGKKEDTESKKESLKGTVICQAKKCGNYLYKNESSSLRGYCLECG